MAAMSRVLFNAPTKLRSVKSIDAISLGGQLITSERELQRFFNRLIGDQSIANPPTRTQRLRLRVERAETVLRAAGN
jgi:hypothetical protein